MDVTVVGAGVAGLSTALALEQRGHRVRIVARAQGGAITSALAGAVWFPYHAGPPDKVASWAARTRAWLEQLAVRTPDAGVDVLTGYEITRDASDPWWAAAVPIASEGTLASSAAEGRRGSIERVPAPVAGAPAAWKFVAPRAEPALFLPWLAAQLRARVEYGEIAALADVPGDAVVNCTGLAARELAGDPQLTPLLGQTLICAPGGVDLAVSITDARDDDAIFYVIPRRTELVVGGCAIDVPPGTEPRVDPAITQRILAHARALGLPLGPLRAERVGLRPARREVRLERDPRDPRIVHNYGHGGAGFTLCHGCAEDVAALVEDA